MLIQFKQYDWMLVQPTHFSDPLWTWRYKETYNLIRPAYLMLPSSPHMLNHFYNYFSAYCHPECFHPYCRSVNVLLSNMPDGKVREIAVKEHSLFLDAIHSRVKSFSYQSIRISLLPPRHVLFRTGSLQSDFLPLHFQSAVHPIHIRKWIERKVEFSAVPLPLETVRRKNVPFPSLLRRAILHNALVYGYAKLYTAIRNPLYESLFVWFSTVVPRRK